MASATLVLSNSSLLPKKTVLPSQSAPTPKSWTAFLPPGRSSVIRADASGNNKGNGKGGAVERRRVEISPLGKSSSDDQKWVHRGLITESLSNGMFKVRIGNGDEVIGYISGKIRKNFIRMLPGDRVEIEVSRYDSTRGRIIYRLSNKDV